jgi:hypothetical protein
MTNLNKYVRAILIFSLGMIVGSIGLGVATANETPAPVATIVEPQGEVLSVCIDKKSGIIRAAVSCKKTERATTLGGVGPKGEKGDTGETGATGLQGLRGFTGLTGATGSISGLTTTNIDFLSGSSFGCPGFGTSKTVMTDVSVSTSSFTGRTSITPYTTRLNGCSLTVLTR